MGGMIGGADQQGQYKLDARFNRDDLVSRIQEISKYKHQIVLTNLDAKELLSTENLRHYYKVFINLDPPYVKKGKQLYKNAFSLDDHRELHNIINSCQRKWIVTYDNVNAVKSMYSKVRCIEFALQYSLQA